MNEVVRFDAYAQSWRAPGESFRQPPHNVGAEQALIGAVLVNNQAWHVVGTRVAKEHFAEEIHQRIWDVASTLIRDGKPATPITLRTWLGEFDLGDGMTVPGYLAQLAREAVTIINAPDYAQMVADLAVRRQVITAEQEVIEQAYDAPVGLSVAKLVDDAIETLRAIGEALPQTQERETVDRALTRVLARAQDRLDGKSIQVPFTGLDDFDRRLRGGLLPGRLIVLAGRPGMAKTVLATAVARRAAQRGFGVASFNLEIDCEETGARLIANMMANSSHPICYGEIVGAGLTSEQIERIAEEQALLARLPLEVDERAGITMAQIETRAIQADKRFHRMGKRLDVIVIDYLQLVRVTDRYKGKTVEELGEVVLAAKNMAKRLKVCAVLLSQLNRGVEHRESKRPGLLDLRGSGNIEEHADAVGMLYRPAYYDKDDPKVLAEDPEALARAAARAKHLEVIWQKNRLGPTGHDTFYCDVGRSQVDSMARHRGGE